MIMKVLMTMHVSKLFMMIIESIVYRHFGMIEDRWKEYVGSTDLEVRAVGKRCRYRAIDLHERQVEGDEILKLTERLRDDARKVISTEVQFLKKSAFGELRR